MTTADDCPDGTAHLVDTFDIEMRAEALATITEHVRIGGTVLETGGILLGHNYEDRCAVLVAGDPGPNAIRDRRAFSRDRGHAERLADAAWTDYRADWIGEWHSHPQGPATPSDIDLASYLDHLNDPDLGFDYFISLIVALRQSEEHALADQPQTARVPAIMTAWVIRADRVERARITTLQETS